MPDRQTVVFLHGQPGTSVESLQLRRALPPWLHLVAPDRPGYGANPKPATGFFGNARFVLDVREAFHQSDENQTGLVTVAAVIAALHFAAASGNPDALMFSTRPVPLS